MKQTLHTLLLTVLFAFVLASCSTTRKVTETKEQHDSAASVKTEQQSQTTANDALATLVTETDKSTIVIDFVKTEYADGSTDITATGADVQNGTMQRGDREATEPPNVGKSVKSVTSGRVTINNDKKRQEDTNLQHSEATQTAEATSAEMTENDKSQTEVTEQPKSNLFWWGVAAGLLAFIGIALLLYRLKRK